MAETQAETKSAKEIGRTNYFQGLAWSVYPGMRLLFRGGKLSKKDKWRNVAEHCLVQVAVVDKLTDLLKLPTEDKNTLKNVAACHDWEKRLKIKPGNFNETEKSLAEKLLKSVKPDQKLMDATGPDFIEKALVKEDSTFMERLQFYVDDIVSDTGVVELEKRIDEVEEKRQDLNKDKALTARLGGQYWDKERELGFMVEQEIFEKLPPEVQTQVGEPKNIPNYLLSQIEKNYIA
ncbi:hypothetical protein ISR94_01175 [Candidatus Microgenomates bacterium]|nr:hypothetical protein [Candidatus Microgenomates bacterium]